MSGGQFNSRQAAIKDANKCMRAKFGNEIKFPDGDNGILPNSGDPMWFFRVTDPLMNENARYKVFRKGKAFTWQEEPSAPGVG